MDMIVGRVDTGFYRRSYPDLAGFTDAELVQHYTRYGMAEGRLACPEGVREGFLELVPHDGLVLEIGPFSDPVLRGPHIRYADVLSTAQLRERARSVGRDPAGCPEIDYVLPTFDLGSIGERFAAVVSCHCIEHQPDLVRHLEEVASMLDPGGRYFVIVPDKRYCFDHFLAESTIADVAAAHLREQRLHGVASVIEHWALTTHNDSARHWAGDHGRPRIDDTIDPVERAIATCTADPDRYIDVHAWQFTPSSFHRLINLLADRRWIGFRPSAVHSTVRPRNEFCAVLSGEPSSP